MLIVDDSPVNLKLANSILVGRGFKTHLISNSLEVVQWVEQNQPDLILLDIMMPDLDGLQICRLLKKNPKTETIPVIFLTAKTGPQNLVEGFEAGGSDYLGKPFQTEELIARVRVHIHLQLLQRELKVKNQTLEDSLEHIAKLKNAVLRICAWTKQVNVDGKWIPIDEYLHAHLGLTLTHGMSEEAIESFTAEENPTSKKRV